jgi:putative phosphoribosyl transferase
MPGNVAAVVSRGGRPDLAAEYLPRVKAPTLLIVGGNDREVLQLNRAALAELRCEKELSVVAGATHLFPEPGALDEVAKRTTDWYLGRLDGPWAGSRAITHETDWIEAT